MGRFLERSNKNLYELLVEVDTSKFNANWVGKSQDGKGMYWNHSLAANLVFVPPSGHTLLEQAIELFDRLMAPPRKNKPRDSMILEQ